VTLHNRLNKDEIRSFAETFRHQLAEAKEAVRLAVEAEDRRSKNLALAGLADPKKQQLKTNSTHTTNSTKSTLNATAPNNASKTAIKDPPAANASATPATAAPATAAPATATPAAAPAGNATDAAATAVAAPT
jgi:hypothetical protein